MNETAPAPTAPLRARAEIDLGALRANVRTLRALAPGAALMAVV
ncbi:alanine racemase, partial [Streptomyces sp. W16]|nr:alanine racemase [Streptomyces sp. W16]